MIWKIVAGIAGLIAASIPVWGASCVPVDVAATSYGVICDGVTDTTVALQTAITTVQAQMGTLHLPSGNCKITAPLAISAPITLMGNGKKSSVLMPAGAIDALDVLTSMPVIIERLGIDYGSFQGGGTAITVSGTATTGNGSTVIRDVEIDNTFNGITFLKSAFFVIDGVDIYTFNGNGITISNSMNPDVGDGIITNSSIFANFFGAGAGDCVFWNSSGGLRVENNKFATCLHGINMSLANGAVTAQLDVAGNSFDTTNTGILISRLGGSGIFNSVIVANNMFADNVGGINIIHDAYGQWLNTVVISGNTYISQNNPRSYFAIVNDTAGFIISGNALTSNNASAIAFQFGQLASSGSLGPNIKIGAWQASYFGGSGLTQIGSN